MRLVAPAIIYTQLTVIFIAILLFSSSLQAQSDEDCLMCHE